VTRSTLPLLLLALALSACSGSKDSSPSPQPSPSSSAADAGPVAAWTSIAVPAAALPRHPVVEIDDSAAAAGKLPAVFGGSVTKPGGSSTATVWRPGAAGLGKATTLKTSGDASYLGLLASDGTTTYAAGSSWAAGQVTPFLQKSSDRRTWTPVTLPAEVTKRGISLAGLAPLSGGKVVAVGLDEDHRAVAVAPGGGTLTDLSEAPGDLDSISAVAARGRLVVVLAAGTARNGQPTLVGYRSTDAGRTWKRVAAPSGQQANVAGIAVVRRGFVATGWRQSGSASEMAAWSSKDGTAWTAEKLPALPNHDAGWDASLSAPTASGPTAYAAATDGERLTNQVLRRAANGAWSILGEAPRWLTPGPGATVAATKAGVVLARTWNGALQVGNLSGSGSWQTRGTTGLDHAPVDWWDSVDLVDNEPVLVGGHTTVSFGSGDQWTRATQLTRFSVKGKRLRRSAWTPAAAAGLSGVAAATNTAGKTVVVGVRLHPQTRTNGSDLVGWMKSAGGWKPATGLAGPRTEFLDDVTAVGKRWVAVGYDRASFTGSDHFYGAVWVSTDGQHWTRQRGGFDVDPKQNSSLAGSCQLPDGDLLAVGSVGDASSGTRPLAFERTKAGWKRHAFQGLGSKVRSFSSCANTGEVTLLQGTESGHQRLWSTTDGTHLTRVTVGADDDYVGEVTSIPGGFAAPGGQYAGLKSQAVVWLSKDARSWRAVPVPGDRPVSADTVLPWGKRLLVAELDSNGGPAVAVLDNPADLLTD